MALQKAILFIHDRDDQKFYFLRLSTKKALHGDRKVVAVGDDGFGNRMELDPNKLWGEDSEWKFNGGRVYES